MGTLCVCSPPCPAHLESPFGGAAPRPWEADSESADAAWAPHCGRADPGWGVPPRSVKLGLPGVRWERWVPRCEGVSALGMRAGAGDTQLGDPIHWPLTTGVQMGLPALS